MTAKQPTTGHNHMKAIAALLMLCAIGLSARADTVITTEGPVKGNKLDGVVQYLGIPYAQPPVDDLRYLPPAPPEPRGELFQALQFGAVCPQSPNRASRDMSEDCLTLNIWASASGADNAPVAVWIHGGGFTAGSGSEPHLNHRVFTDEGIVFVTFNYRLGAIGFMATDNHPIANRGFADMSAALGWLQNNISAFGGDPSNITIMGESAGGMAVQSLMTMPATKGLFKRAIAQSGYATWPLPNVNEAQKIAEDIVAKAGTIDAPAEQLVSAISGFHLPIIDGHTLTDQPSTLFIQGAAHSVDYLTGANSLDGSVFPFSGVTFGQFSQLLGEATNPLVGSHMKQGLSSEVAVAKLFGEARYLLASHTTSLAHSDSANTYKYFFDYVPNGYRAQWFGAPHASELPLLFDAPNDLYPNEGFNSPIGEQLRQYWIAFIKTGNPNRGNLPEWRTVSETNDWLVFGDDGITIQPQITPTLTTLSSNWPTLRTTND